MEIQETFQRVEKKYLMNPKQYRALRPIIEQHMQTDQFGVDTINNIYYDTKDYLLIRRSIEKPVYKEKLRARAYGAKVAENGRIFTEIKKKYNGIVYKRRIAICASDLNDFLKPNGVRPVCDNPQIASEIEYVRDFYHLEPKIYLGYHREAMYGKEDPSLRLTFDTDITWRTEKVSLTDGFWGNPLLPEPMILMEIKIPGALPLWLAEAMERCGVRKTSFSKYGYCYQHYLSRENEKVVSFQDMKSDVGRNHIGRRNVQEKNILIGEIRENQTEERRGTKVC